LIRTIIFKQESMAVEISAEYVGELRVEATHGPSGASLATDAPVDNGGRGASYSPTDLVATALGTCVLTIIGLFAKRHELDLQGAKIQVAKEMIADPIRRITSLRTTVTVPSAAIQDEKLRKQMEAAARKCPVHQSLHPKIEAPIDFVYR
jgi:putative redox protein